MESILNRIDCRAKRALYTAYCILFAVSLIIICGMLILIQAQELVKDESETSRLGETLENDGHKLNLAINKLRKIVKNEIQNRFGNPTAEFKKMLASFNNPDIDYNPYCPDQFYFSNLYTDGTNKEYIGEVVFVPSIQEKKVCYNLMLDLSSVTVSERDRTNFQKEISKYILHSIDDREDYVASFNLSFSDINKVPGIFVKREGEVAIDEEVTIKAFRNIGDHLLASLMSNPEVRNEIFATIQMFKSFYSNWLTYTSSNDRVTSAIPDAYYEMYPGDRKFILIQVSVLRLGVIFLLIFLVSIIVPLYRYNIQLAAYYFGLADLLRLSSPDDTPWPLEAASSVLIPKFRLGKEPATPIDSFTKVFNWKS